jgi:hypothetical protein
MHIRYRLRLDESASALIPSLFAFRSDRVDSSPDEGLDFCDIFIPKLARKVGHAPVTERSLEQDVLEIGDLFGRDIAKIPEVATLVDAGDAVAGGARRDIGWRTKS